MTDPGPLDEDAVAEIPPGEAKPGSVQGGGSEIGQSDVPSAGAAAGSRLDDVPVEIVDEDKGATGE